MVFPFSVPTPSADAVQEKPRALSETARELGARIAELRGRQRRVSLCTGLAMALVAVLGWLAAECAADWWVELPWLARLACFVVGVGGAGALAWWFGVRPFRAPLADDAVALMVERALPAFRSRFIAAVQLARGEAGSSALVRALVAETTALALTQKFDRVVHTDRLRRWAKIAGVTLLCAVALAVAGGENTSPLLGRAFLSAQPVPRKTKIADISGSRAIALGDDFKIEATAGGVVPARGRVLIKSASGRRQEFAFEPERERPRHFVRLLQSVQESFEYTIELGDAKTAVFTVKAMPRPTVAGVECRQIFPAYTKLPPQRRAMGELKILAGSRLALRVKASRPVKTALIRLVAADREEPLREVAMTADAQDAAVLTGEVEVPAKDVSGLTFHLADSDGLESRNSAVYRIEVVPDAPPLISIRWPDRREELLTRDATMLLAFDAKDDYGIGKVRLHHAVDWTEGAAFKTLDLDLGGDTPTVLARRFHWKIAQLAPRPEEGSVIDYWFEVVDANDVTGPGIGTMEHYQARVVSEVEKRADLAARLSDTVEGLNEVRQLQEELNKNLGEMIFEKPTPAPSVVPVPQIP